MATTYASSTTSTGWTNGSWDSTVDPYEAERQRLMMRQMEAAAQHQAHAIFNPEQNRMIRVDGRQHGKTARMEAAHIRERSFLDQLRYERDEWLKDALE